MVQLIRYRDAINELVNGGKLFWVIVNDDELL